MKLLEELLLDPIKARKLRGAVSTFNGLLEEAGLVHKEEGGADGETKQVELPAPEEIAAAITEVMVDKLGDDVPANAIDIAEDAARSVLDMVEVALAEVMAEAEAAMDEVEGEEMAVDISPEEKAALAEEDKALRARLTKALEGAQGENIALGELITEDVNAAVVTATETKAKVNELVEAFNAMRGELDQRVKKIGTDVALVKRQLTRVGKRASEADDTEVKIEDVPAEIKAADKKPGTKITGELKTMDEVMAQYPR